MFTHVWRAAKVRLSGPPSAYRPGRLLQQLRPDLVDFELDSLDASHARIRSAPLDLELEVREVVEAQFLMHLVSAEFIFTLAAATAPEPVTISARHQGTLRRTGVEFVADGQRHHWLVRRLSESAALRTALLRLDFTLWRLRSSDAGWKLTVRHFGASEVVGQMPAFRRYIRLERAQYAALMDSLQEARNLLQRQ